MVMVKNMKIVGSASLKTYVLYQVMQCIELLMFSYVTDLMMRLLSKLIRLASKNVYYFSKILNKVYFVYPHIPSI